MTRLVRGGVVLAALVSAVGFAQDMTVQVDDDAASAHAGVRMDVQAPDMNVRVRVRQRTTTTVVAPVVVEEQVQPVYVQPQAVVVAPVVVRDCGTGNDPGCAMARDGQYPMDAVAFRGLLEALRANANELTREELCETALAGNSLTAAQLGQVLDLFRNELTRLDVAKVAAPRVVNPAHAFGHAAKFRNGILGKEYTEVMAAQR